MQIKVGSDQLHSINGINKKVLMYFWNTIFYRTEEIAFKKKKINKKIRKTQSIQN